MVEILKKSLKIVPDSEGFEYTEEETKLEDEENAILDPEDDKFDASNTSDDLIYTCPQCQKIFEEKIEVILHIDHCENVQEGCPEEEVEENM